MKACRQSLLVTALISCSLAVAMGDAISTANINGETVVEWNGKEVFRDEVDVPVRSKSSKVDGKGLAAVVTEDGKVLWESEPGAAAALALVDPAKIARDANANIGIETADGESVVIFQGKEVWKGKTKEDVYGLAKEIDGKTYAAAFDGDKVIWENVRGAAKKVGKAAKKPRGLKQARGVS